MYVIHVVELFYVSPRYSVCFFLTQNLSGDEKNSPMAWSPLKLISPLAKKYMAMLHAARENSITGSQKNIQAKLKGKELADSAGFYGSDERTHDGHGLLGNGPSAFC